MTAAGPPAGAAAAAAAVWPGSPVPLGVHWDGEGVNVAVFAEAADGVSLCVFDDAGVEQRWPLLERTGHVWHGYVPGVAPGARYGLRADGGYDPASGRRYDPAKLLADPYARAFDGEFRWGPEHRTHGADTAGCTPRGVVVADAFPWGDERRPRHALADSVLYELHVGGFTARHPGIPERLRGTYAGLAHPAAIDHLHRLGVTAVELMPVHHFVSEPHLTERGLANYWGYNSLGYFAPHAGYRASDDPAGVVGEFKAMVRALHRADIEVVLDVVYNHTAEGDERGPTLSFRGLDNAAYYRLRDDDPSRYLDYTGCGNTLDARQPHVLQVIMDSLRYWVQEMHVDGFRFDLAAALARSFHDVDKLSGFFDCIAQDPVISRVKLIAEPWDVGAGGYQVGEFPPLWAEWNGKFRDAVRDVWRGQQTSVAELGYRLTGSSDLYQDDGRRPYASVNFVTAHDGFTLADLVSFERKHNAANGEDGRDGTDDNRSANSGAEGPTTDAAVLADRRSRRRALLATLLLAAGVPMLRAGDEFGQTQLGNNNAYCQDTALSWLNWPGAQPLDPGVAAELGGDVDADPAGHDPALLALIRALIALRRRSPVLRQRAFFSGQPVGPGGRKDIAWLTVDGTEMSADDWQGPAAATLGMFLNGDAIRTRGPRGEPIRDLSYLLWLHLGSEPAVVTVPGAPWGTGYAVVCDTGADDPLPSAATAVPGGATLALQPRSVVLLRVDPHD